MVVAELKSNTQLGNLGVEVFAFHLLLLVAIEEEVRPWRGGWWLAM